MILFEVHKMVRELLGARISKPTTIAFVQCLTSPINTFFDSFYLFYEKNKYDLSITSQVIYLERVLNDSFDSSNRGIYITDANVLASELVLYNEIEQNEETVLYNESEGLEETILYNESEYTTSPNFIVNVPQTLNFNLNQMRKTIDVYKASGKNYIIQYF
jgi:hypothetical protein